jgi:transposase-like protein
MTMTDLQATLLVQEVARMAGRRIVNEHDARRCLAAARSSQGGLGAWARTHGVDGRSLNAWRVNLERGGIGRAPGAGVKLVEVVPAAAVSAQRPPPPYVLHISGVELEVGDDFEEQALRRLVVVLKSC